MQVSVKNYYANMLNNNRHRGNIPYPTPYFRLPLEAEPFLLLQLRHPAEERVQSGGTREVSVFMFGDWGYEPSNLCWLRIISLQARIAFMRNISVHTRVHIVGDVSHTNYSHANETLR